MKSFFRGGVTLVVLLVLAVVSVRQAAGQVVINEIMYRPPPRLPENPGLEWVELYNRSSSPIDLSGWKLTKGVSFTFTNTVLPPQGFLVVAANRDLFKTAFPQTTNVVGNWTGKLGNNGDKVELENALGQKMDTVEFFNEGDWALRRKGDPYPGKSDWWSGWKWHSPADGEGSTLELVNPELPNQHGQSWAASLEQGGTPGRPNSVLAGSVPPLILETRHLPAIPRSTDSVHVTSRITPGLSAVKEVWLHYRVDGTTNFHSVEMIDDGLNGDGLRGDGVYGARVPAQPDKTVVEFYVRAESAAGFARTWPGPTDALGTQGANALYQVDDFGDTYSGTQPVYRFVVIGSEWNEWVYLMDNVSGGRFSNARMNGSLVRLDSAGTETRYSIGLRNRGAGTRAAKPHNLSLSIPADRDLKGIRRLGFNTRTVHSQVAGNAIFSAAGLLNAYGAPVQVRVNGQNLANAAPDGRTDSFQFGSYYCYEPYASEWGERHVPQDPNGNLYSGIWYFDTISLMRGATLEYLGTDVASYRLAYSPTGPVSTSGAYDKDSNRAEDDWSDLIHLTYVLSTNTPDADYVQAVEQVLNLDQWLRHIATHSLLLNMETTLANGAGDDYSSYRGVKDPRFQLLPHDMDTVLGAGENSPSWERSIFKAADLPVLNRLLKHPSIVPRYFSNLQQLANTVFAPERINSLLDQHLQGWVPGAYIDSMKEAAQRRRTNVLAQIPLALTVHSELPVSNGFPRTTSGVVELSGTANAIQTRSVAVNGKPVSYTAWQGRWSASGVALQPGINRVLVQAFDSSNAECGRTYLDVWFDDGVGQEVGGNLSTDTIWKPEEGPYEIRTTLTVGSGATLKILPGTTVFLSEGVNLVVANGGTLLAEGTAAAPIRFSARPGTGATWGGLTINGGLGSPESRIVHAYFEGNGSKCIQVTGGTLYLAHTRFGTTTRQYLSLDGSSFLVEHCTFPTATTQFELVHGSQGIKAGGRGIFRKCFFGAASGYNDVIDFTGGNREDGQPVLQVYDSVFVGSGDDLLDLDGTDAWVEGNIFLNVHRNGAPDSASAISGGSNGSRTSEVTVVRNLFFNCDHAATAKQGNFYTFFQNTIVRTTRSGGQDTAAAVVNLQDLEPSPTTFGRGVYFEGNIVVDAEALVRNYDPAVSAVTFTNNLLPASWSGPGGGNRVADPLLRYIPKPEEAVFDNWQAAQVFWEWFSLREGSPATARGWAGQDIGAVIPTGVLIHGEGVPVTYSTTALFTIGTWQSGFGVAGPGFPEGSGYTHYRWRLDGGPWSQELPVSSPILLEPLSEGRHHLEVSGRRDSGIYQDAAELEGSPTLWSWDVDTSSRRVWINEVLADNQGIAPVDDSSPDLIELYNPSAGAIDLSGMSLSDDPANPAKHVFPAGTMLGSGSYMVLIADGTAGGSHVAFGLSKAGGGVYLFDAPSKGGTLVDQVVYGQQLPNYSIGRLPTGKWSLTLPTFGRNNIPVPVGGPYTVRINEWLASSQVEPEFIELFNPDPVPVNIGGCSLTDTPAGHPARSPIAPLTFIAPRGYLLFLADGTHVNFRLEDEWGAIGLFSPELEPVDIVLYGPQRSQFSMGRSPDGAQDIRSFAIPTPGTGNPYTDRFYTVTNLTVDLMPFEAIWKYNETSNLDGVAWLTDDYDDSNWSSGPGLLGFERSSQIIPLIRTPLSDPREPASGLTAGHAVYFRKALWVTNDLSEFTLHGRMRLDDGGLLYINGVEVLRQRMRASEIVTNASFATGSPGSSDALVDENFWLPGSLLREGLNIIAAEVHQVNATSSDVVWGLALTAVKSITNWTQLDLVMNEVMANNQSMPHADGAVTDWVEFHNPGAAVVDLSGMTVRGDPSKPAKQWSFPSALTVEPGGYLVVRFDPNSPATTNLAPVLNTGFGIDASGEKLFLYSGASLLDAVSFGPQAADFSIARVPDGNGDWRLCLPTPGNAAVLAHLADPGGLRVNEWMADPKSGDDWFELYNMNPQPVALGGLCLTDDLNRPRQFVIAPLSFIGAGPIGAFLQFRADSNPTNGPTHTNFRLSAGGESIGLFSPDGATPIHAVTFGSQVEGISEGFFPDGAERLVRFPRSPTPGAANYLAYNDVVINEVLAEPVTGGQQIELWNQTDQSVDLSGAWLSDDVQVPKKYRLPDPTILAPGEYAVLGEAEFNSRPGVSPSFGLDPVNGGSLVLSLALPDGEPTGYRAQMTYRAAGAGVSYGLYEASTGPQSVALSARSFAGANAGPIIGPVVISEVHYHPPDLATSDNLVDEFIELMNVSSSQVALHDPQEPLNTWHVRGGVSYDFPAHTSLPAGGTLILVSFDPVLNAFAAAEFRQKFSVPSGVPLFGPWSGKLDNGGEKLELNRPLRTSGGTVVRTLVEVLEYDDKGSWPAAADGAGTGVGYSLQRRQLTVFGNDPVNWVAANPTAGRETVFSPAVVPSLTSQPANQLVSAGSAASFSVAASGPSPLAFQWRYQGIDLLDETNASLSIPATREADEGRYSVRVSNPYGCVVSANARLKVKAAPVFTRQPEGGMAATQPFWLAAVARGTAPLSYQWYRDGEPIATAQATTLLLSAPQAQDAGDYLLVVRNVYGSVTSVVATVTTSLLDSDLDGIPDAWMVQHFGHPTAQSHDQSGAEDDPDQDGMRNLDEYRAGTLPLDGSSSLEVVLLPGVQPGQVRIGFRAQANRAYVLQQRRSFSFEWSDLLNIPPGPARVVETDSSQQEGDRFYRIKTWAQ